MAADCDSELFGLFEQCPLLLHAEVLEQGNMVGALEAVISQGIQYL